MSDAACDLARCVLRLAQDRSAGRIDQDRDLTLIKGLANDGGTCDFSWPTRRVFTYVLGLTRPQARSAQCPNSRFRAIDIVFINRAI
jgi:hypothetical protein